MIHVLTREELHSITGYQRPADQRRWLQSRGWTFEVAAGGKPVVAADYANQRLGVREESRGWKPDFTGLRGSA
jgi:hypothetical protein